MGRELSRNEIKLTGRPYGGVLNLLLHFWRERHILEILIARAAFKFCEHCTDLA